MRRRRKEICRPRSRPTINIWPFAPTTRIPGTRAGTSSTISNHDDEAVEAYRKVLALKPDFIGYQDYVKLAIVYADQKKFALADSALQEYGKRATGAAKFYVSVFAGQFQETRGDLEGARASYQRAVGNWRRRAKRWRRGCAPCRWPRFRF